MFLFTLLKGALCNLKMKYFTLKCILNNYVFICLCSYLKKYTYFDVLTNTSMCKVLGYHFNCGVLFDITFNIQVHLNKLKCRGKVNLFQ